VQSDRVNGRRDQAATVSIVQSVTRTPLDDVGERFVAFQTAPATLRGLGERERGSLRALRDRIRRRSSGGGRHGLEGCLAEPGSFIVRANSLWRKSCCLQPPPLPYGCVAVACGKSLGYSGATAPNLIMGPTEAGTVSATQHFRHRLLRPRFDPCSGWGRGSASAGPSHSPVVATHTAGRAVQDVARVCCRAAKGDSGRGQLELRVLYRSTLAVEDRENAMALSASGRRLL
jgi:hypothetical protein